jgi:regulator of sirC expression with transglutaminase-like and TPR domain
MAGVQNSYQPTSRKQAFNQFLLQDLGFQGEPHTWKIENGSPPQI